MGYGGFGGGNGAGILFWFGKIDGNIQVSIFSGCNPLHILCNPVAPDIVGILAKSVIPISSSFSALSKPAPELGSHPVWPGRQYGH